MVDGGVVSNVLVELVWEWVCDGWFGICNVCYLVFDCFYLYWDF